MKSEVPYILLGERCSGTNVIEQLISANSVFKPDWSLVGFKHFPRHESRSGFKGIQHVPVVLVVRESVSWIRSFYRQPWHAAPALKALSFSDFIRSEWHSVWDVDTFTAPGSDQYMQEMLLDRNPYTQERYRNVMALRAGKLRHMLDILRQSSQKTIVRLEDYQSSPRETLRQILVALGCSIPARMSIPSGYKSGSTRVSRLLSAVGLSTLYRSRTQFMNSRILPAISEDDLAFIQNSLDPALEAMVGYPQH